MPVLSRQRQLKQRTNKRRKATGSGGLAALVGALLRKSARKLFTQDTDTKEVEHGHDNNGPQAVERGVAQRVD